MKFCWAYRKWISYDTDTGTPPARAVLRHLDSCPPCRVFAARMQGIGRRLAESAGPSSGRMPPYLAARVMNRIRQEEVRSPGRFLLRPGLLAAGAGTAVVAAALLLSPWLGRYAGGPDEPAPGIDAARLLRPEAQWPATGEILQLSQGLDRPLEQELLGLVQDTRGVVNALASNFRPETVVEPQSYEIK